VLKQERDLCAASQNPYNTAQLQTMERANSTFIPPTEEETVLAHIARSTQNAFYSCFGCLQTSKEKAMIRYKEYEIEQRKKEFGVDYMNLKKQGQENQLQDCVDTALFRIAMFETEIQNLMTTIAAKDNALKSRLIPAPRTPVSAAATPTSAVIPTTPPPETAMTPLVALQTPTAPLRPEQTATTVPKHPITTAPNLDPVTETDVMVEPPITTAPNPDPVSETDVVVVPP
jgi:hypothetical protein